MYFDHILPSRTKTNMILKQKIEFTYKIIYDIYQLVYFCINNIILCVFNYSVGIIPHCVSFFRTQFDFCALFHLKSNCYLHQIYNLSVFVHPYVPIFYCINLWICLKYI